MFQDSGSKTGGAASEKLQAARGGVSSPVRVALAPNRAPLFRRNCDTRNPAVIADFPLEGTFKL
jgi:hypothetical protein